MKAYKSIGQLLAEGREQEGAGRLEEAAEAYQRAVDLDAGNQKAINRLVMIYRRLKDYKRELAAINDALAFASRQDKAAQEKWLTAHPVVAKLSKQVLQKLGGKDVTAFGTDPFVGKLLKRKGFVEKRIGTGKAVRKEKSAAVEKKRKVKGKKRIAENAKKNAEGGKRVLADGRRQAADARNAEREERRRQVKKAEERKAQKKQAEEASKAAAAAAEVKRKEAAERKRLAEETKKAAAEKRKRAAEEKKESRRTEKDEREKPSLFVVSLQYLAPMERIAGVEEKQRIFLKQHFEKGNFVAAGPQTPAAGYTIVMGGKAEW